MIPETINGTTETTYKSLCRDASVPRWEQNSFMNNAIHLLNTADKKLKSLEKTIDKLEKKIKVLEKEVKRSY